MVDFHSHILPCIDDGAASIGESIEILQMLKKQGVTTVIATPHFFNDLINIDDFLNNRNTSFSRLTGIIEAERINTPKILLGAEVYLTYNIESYDLKKLCIGNSNCILIEIPNGLLIEYVHKTILELITERNLIPIIAHAERFASGYNNIDEILKTEAYFQINADSFGKWGIRKNIKKIFDRSDAVLLGSDSHNSTTRAPGMDIAYKSVIKHYGIKKWSLLEGNELKLINTF